MGRKAAEIVRAKEMEEENRKYEEEKRKKREAEKQRQLEYERQRKADLEERRQAEAAKEAAKKKADEERRKAREQQRKAALEELQKVRRQSQAVREDITKELSSTSATPENKENIPKNDGHILPADLIEKKSVEEQKRRASYGVVKNVLEQDSAHRKEAESVVAASRKAAEEVAEVKTRMEATLEKSGRGEQEGPVYYGINSTARRSSQDFGGAKKDVNVINDDL